MTLHMRVTLACEATPPCTAAFAGDGWPGEVRAEAKKAGWTHQDGDRCPRHPPGGSPPPPVLFDLPDAP